VVLELGHLDVERRGSFVQIGLGLWQPGSEGGLDLGNLDLGDHIDIGLDSAGDLDLGSFRDRGLILGLGRRGRIEGDGRGGNSSGPGAGGLGSLVFLQTFDEVGFLASPGERKTVEKKVSCQSTLTFVIPLSPD